MAKKGRKAMSAAKKPVKRPRKMATPPSAKQRKESPERRKRVAGTVLKIANGKPTSQRLDAQEAFSDPQQAMEQVLYAERHASREELRLVRLAYRQCQGKRFRSK